MSQATVSLFHDGRLNHRKKTNPETRLEYLNHKLDQPRPAGSVEAPLPRACLWTRMAVGAVGPGLPQLPSNKAEKSGEGCPLIQTLRSFPSRVTLSTPRITRRPGSCSEGPDTNPCDTRALQTGQEQDPGCSKLCAREEVQCPDRVPGPEADL